jgi:glutamate 5-kinase
MTKISAAKLMNKYSIPTVILNGKQKDILINAMSERVDATIFLGEAMHSGR